MLVIMYVNLSHTPFSLPSFVGSPRLCAVPVACIQNMHVSPLHMTVINGYVFGIQSLLNNKANANAELTGEAFAAAGTVFGVVEMGADGENDGGAKVTAILLMMSVIEER